MSEPQDSLNLMKFTIPVTNPALHKFWYWKSWVLPTTQKDINVELSNSILQNAQNISISGGSFNVVGRDIIYTPGTSQWILENSGYLDWKEEKHKKILWIQGKAGSGTTLLIHDYAFQPPLFTSKFDLLDNILGQQ
ncbi:hypothetical protein EV360DRAFT_75370 [Lentinula raphanica]|nr:hypothetical protein EV360DRAFT_75370 [Lentinula raphanica]